MDHRTFTATGHGTVRVDADAAEVRVAAVARESSVADALGAVDAAVRLIGTITREVAAAADLSSTGLSVWPRHDHRDRPDGFEARHSLEIRCPDLDSASALVGALAERVAGRLAVEQVGLVVTDRQEPEDRAREAAYVEARRRAEHLAGLAGERLGPVVSASEGPRADWATGGQMIRAASAGLDPTFERGGQTVSASVSVTWAVEV